MYTFESRVRFSETDEEEKLSLEGVLNYLQDCCVFHSQDAGVGNAWQRERDKVWMLASWQIIIDERPALFEKITIGTQPYEFSGLYGKRNHWIWGSDGRVCVKAASHWCIVSPTTGKVARITDEDKAAYDVAPPMEMDYAPRKILLLRGGERRDAFRVGRRDLDSNHHVNNARYVLMAMDYLPDGLKPAQVRAEYRAQATLGSLIIPVVTSENGVFTVSLEGEDGAPYAIVECRS